MEKTNKMNEKPKFKLISNVSEQKQSVFKSKPTKLCLSYQQQQNKMNIYHRDTGNLDHSLLTDDESEHSFDELKRESNPIFSSSSDKIKEEPGASSEQETYCSELENAPPTVQKIVLNEGSESLFSTQSSKMLSQDIEEKLSQNVNDLILGERFSGVKQNSNNEDEPLLLQSGTSVRTTLSKDTSYIEHFQRHVNQGLYDYDSYREKGEGESPEKRTEASLDTTEDKTPDVLEDTEEKTVCHEKSYEEESINETPKHIVTISSNETQSGESEESVICVSSESEDENEGNITKSSSQLGAVVSSIMSSSLVSLDVTTSSQIDKFFDNVPNLSTPECNEYTKAFDPRKQSDASPTKSGEEIIPESDPEPDTQPTNVDSPVEQVEEPQSKPSKSSSSTTGSSSYEATVTEINISANVQISIKIDPGKSGSSKKTTPVVNVRQSPVHIGRKRKNQSSSKKTPSSPQPGPSKPYQGEQTFRSARKKEAKDLKNIQNQKAKQDTTSLEVDERTANILDQIYGENQWQTPQLKPKTQKRTNPENSVLDFSTCKKLLVTKFSVN